MDHTNPLSVVTPSLDGPVLLALSGTTGSFTGRQVHRLTDRGSADGVRKALARLADQGIVLTDQHPHATLYRLNRDHVAAEPILQLTRIRTTVVDRVRKEIAGWIMPPLHASIFGSFARNEADSASDIDILVVPAETAEGAERWFEQVDRLARQVRLWTGNDAHIVDATRHTLTAMLRADDPLIGSWRAEALHLAGQPLMDLLRELRVRAELPLNGLR
jgi:predicted nucleotidyltransferase